MAWWFGFLPSEDRPSLTGRTVACGPYETSEQAIRARANAKYGEVTVSEPFEAKNQEEAQSQSDAKLIFNDCAKERGVEKRTPSLVSFE